MNQRLALPSRTTWTWRCPIAALAGLALTACAPADGGRSFAPPEVGDPAPMYEGTTLSGAELTIGGESETVTLLNVWATWCVPCRTEMPDLEEIYQEFRDRGLVVVGVSVDLSGPDRVQSFLDEVGTTFPIIHDPEGVIEDRYPSIGLPNTYLIDRSGTLVQSWLGPLPVAPAREVIAATLGT